MINEIKLMRIMQKLNFSNQMKVITTPFNTNGFIFMILILFIYKIINLHDIKIIMISCLIGVLLKFIFQRKRPYHSNVKIINYSGKEHNNLTNKFSFPSGHTFNATIISLIMLDKFPNEFVFNILAVLIGLSRIFLGVHYPTDIIGGMIFGYLIYNIIN